MLLINLIFEFCVVIVQAGCTPRAWLPSDLATSPLVCNLYLAQLGVKFHVRVAELYKANQSVCYTFILPSRLVMLGNRGRTTA